MSVSVRNNVNTAPHNPITEYNNVKKSAVVTEISVTARIDYILRYSKQAVLVIAEQTQEYSTLARQYLVTLSSENSSSLSNQEQHNQHQSNVAFVSASLKLNDIQIRCRLIEQLFGNTLFDPEQSLAVSVLRLAKNKAETIAIVVEHAQALSMQIKYELSQLVALSKKGNRQINVVMFAKKIAAEEVSNNKSIFKNKLTIIDAISGQLCSLENGQFSEKNSDNWLKPWQKISLIILTAIMIILTVATYTYLQTDTGHQYLTQAGLGLDEGMKNTTKYEDRIAVPEGVFVSTGAEKNKSAINNENKSDIKVIASSEDVNAALINPEYLEDTDIIEVRVAKADEVLASIMKSDKLSLNNIIEKQAEDESSIKKIDPITSNYYINKLKEFTQNNLYKEKDVVVIQIAGFSDNKHLQSFLLQYQSENFYTYQRMLSDKVFTVVTSKAFPDRFTAKESLKGLPDSLIERQLWLKPILTVIAEMNTLND